MVFNNGNSIAEEYMHVTFDETKSKETGRGISSIFDVLGKIVEDLVKDVIPEVNSPKNEDIKDDNDERKQEDDKQNTSIKFPQD